MRIRVAIDCIAAAVFATAAAAPLQAQTVVLNVHHFMPAASAGHTRLVQPWCAKVAQESGQRLQCRIFPAMQLGGLPSQLFDQARDGVADIVWTVPTASAARFGKSEVFELPFFTRSAEGASQALWHYVQRHALDEFDGVRPLWLHVGAGAALHLRPSGVRSLADLRGLRIAAPTRLNARTAASMGAAPVGMGASAVPLAMANHVVDGALASWDSMPADAADGAHSRLVAPDRQPHFANTVYAFVMNSARYDSLPVDLKRVIDANSGVAVSAWAGQRLDQAMVARRGRAADHGQLAVLPHPDYLRWQRATVAVQRQWVQDVTARGAAGEVLLRDALALSRRFDGGSGTIDESSPSILLAMPGR